MIRTCARGMLFVFVVVAATCPAFSQAPRNSSAPPAGLWCGGPRPTAPTAKACWHYYKVPANRLQQLEREIQYCQETGPNTISCWGPVTGNYGQTEFKPEVYVPPQSVTYPIPAAPPPPISPQQQAQADQLWTRANALLDQNKFREGMQLVHQCALLGDRRCESTMGIHFQDGDWLKGSDPKAAYWFGLAAAQGHRAAEYALGGMYEEGEGGLTKDFKKATELYIKSANQGYDKAQLVMGLQYEVGDGVPRNRQKAIELLRACGDSEAVWVASVLTNPKTPARFASFQALGDYLSGLHNAEIAAAWARGQAGLPNGGGGNIMAIIKAGQYRAAGGSNTGQTQGGYTSSHQ